LERAPASPVRVNPDLPSKIEEVINKALEKDREFRYQHAADMRTDLKPLKRESESGHTRPLIESQEPKKWKLLAGVGAAALIIAVGIGAFVRYQFSRPAVVRG
jgi:eukaryotic-like serine/threonine-protein kinase